MRVSVAWHNVFQNKKRALAAVGGISFSILLVFMQLGFLDATRTAAASLFQIFDYDLGIVSERYKFLGAPDSFDRMRLTQAMVLPEVEAAAGLQIGQGFWKDKDTKSTCQVLIFGIPLEPRFIRDPMIRGVIENIRRNNTVLVDLYSHKDFGALFTGREVEVNDKTVSIAGHFRLGVTLFSEGCVIVSGDDFSRLTLQGGRAISYGFLRIRSGADPVKIKDRLKKVLPDDILIFTKKEMIQQEQDYFISVKPVGIIFQVGVLVAFIVGVVILFQVLNTDITTRLDEFATLKAMGFKDWSLYIIGIQQALLYALMGYFPSLVLGLIVFHVVHLLSRMPMDLDFPMALFVFSMSLLMCVISCILGLQKVRRTDPAELY
ncbi:MAG: FtsX-like permease family protein [Thermodesulfobacteriota bacterium]